jgi:phospholipid-binding lipoprotein MlaA
VGRGRRFYACAALAGCFALGAGGARAEDTAELPAEAMGLAPAHDPDPWQRFNRKTFAINDGIDRWVVEPLARGWEWITPEYFCIHLDQVFLNLNFPGYFLNDLLQGEPRQAGKELVRFIGNTTFGVAGFWDPVGHHLGWKGRYEDFGQTLAVWGVGDGVFIVLPLLTLPGATARDLAALPIDTVLNAGDSLALGLLLFGSGAVRDVNRRSLLLDEVRDARVASFDWYVFVRDAHLQLRHTLVHNGDVPSEETDGGLYDLPEDE